MQKTWKGNIVDAQVAQNLSECVSPSPISHGGNLLSAWYFFAICLIFHCLSAIYLSLLSARYCLFLFLIFFCISLFTRCIAQQTIEPCSDAKVLQRQHCDAKLFKSTCLHRLFRMGESDYLSLIIYIQKPFSNEKKNIYFSFYLFCKKEYARRKSTCF